MAPSLPGRLPGPYWVVALERWHLGKAELPAPCSECWGAIEYWMIHFADSTRHCDYEGCWILGHRPVVLHRRRTFVNVLSTCAPANHSGFSAVALHICRAQIRVPPPQRPRVRRWL